MCVKSFNVKPETRKNLPSSVVSSNASLIPGTEDCVPRAIVDLVDYLANPGLA